MLKIVSILSFWFSIIKTLKGKKIKRIILLLDIDFKVNLATWVVFLFYTTLLCLTLSIKAEKRFLLLSNETG